MEFQVSRNRIWRPIAVVVQVDKIKPPRSLVMVAADFPINLVSDRLFCPAFAQCLDIRFNPSLNEPASEVLDIAKLQIVPTSWLVLGVADFAQLDIFSPSLLQLFVRAVAFSQPIVEQAVQVGMVAKLNPSLVFNVPKDARRVFVASADEPNESALLAQSFIANAHAHPLVQCRHQDETVPMRHQHQRIVAAPESFRRLFQIARKMADVKDTQNFQAHLAHQGKLQLPLQWVLPSRFRRKQNACLVRAEPKLWLPKLFVFVPLAQSVVFPSDGRCVPQEAFLPNAKSRPNFVKRRGSRSSFREGEASAEPCSDSVKRSGILWDAPLHRHRRLLPWRERDGSFANRNGLAHLQRFGHRRNFHPHRHRLRCNPVVANLDSYACRFALAVSPERRLQTVQVNAAQHAADDLHQNLLELRKFRQVVAFNPAKRPCASRIRTGKVVHDAEGWTEVATELIASNQHRHKPCPRLRVDRIVASNQPNRCVTLHRLFHPQNNLVPRPPSRAPFKDSCSVNAKRWVKNRKLLRVNVHPVAGVAPTGVDDGLDINVGKLRRAVTVHDGVDGDSCGVFGNPQNDAQLPPTFRALDNLRLVERDAVAVGIKVVGGEVSAVTVNDAVSAHFARQQVAPACPQRHKNPNTMPVYGRILGNDNADAVS